MVHKKTQKNIALPSAAGEYPLVLGWKDDRAIPENLGSDRDTGVASEYNVECITSTHTQIPTLQLPTVNVKG